MAKEQIIDNGRMSVERWKEAVKAGSNDANYRREKGYTMTRDDFFVDGVQWADEHPRKGLVDLDVLWHDVKEKPVFDPANIACNQILVIGKIKSAHGDFAGSVCQIMDDGTIYAPVSGHHYEWGSCPFSQWAYLKDILPRKEENV